MRFEISPQYLLSLCLLCLGQEALHPQRILAGANNDVVKGMSLQVVSREEVVAAMRSQSGYDPAATTNVARFQAAMILSLAQKAQSRNPNGPPLLIRHDVWFRAFLEVFGFTFENAPQYSRMAFENRQDQLVEYRRDHVIPKNADGPVPKTAVNVKVFWPEQKGSPARYSFDDTLSSPSLKVTNARVITYRLLAFENMIVYDEIRGLSGRPTSGVLGLLFRIIGEGKVLSSRIAISGDGLQIARAQVRKGPFELTPIVTVQPDGQTEKGLPANRPDLAAIEEQLKQPIRIEYTPMKW
jgi:hypothetical protein